MGELELAWARNEAEQNARYEEEHHRHEEDWVVQGAHVWTWHQACVDGPDCRAHVLAYDNAVGIPF